MTAHEFIQIIKKKIRDILSARHHYSASGLHSAVHRQYFSELFTALESDLNQQRSWSDPELVTLLQNFIAKHLAACFSVTASDTYKVYEEEKSDSNTAFLESKSNDDLEENTEKNYQDPSAVFYTAQASGAINKLFSDIANWLAPHLDISPIEVLMPGVATKSLNKDFEVCGLVRMQVQGQGLILNPQNRDNSDPVRRVLSSYLKTPIAILLYGNNLYFVRVDNSGDHADYLDIEEIPPQSTRLGYVEQYSALRQCLTPIDALPNEPYQPWNKLRVIQTNMTIEHESVAGSGAIHGHVSADLPVSNSYPTLVQQNQRQVLADGSISENISYWLYGYNHGRWCLQLIDPAKNRAGVTLAKNVFNKNKERLNATALAYIELDKQSVGNFNNIISHYHKERSYVVSADASALSSINFIFNGLKFDDLNQVDVLDILKTHIISDDGKYFIPVKLLALLSIDPVRPRLKVPYVHNPEKSCVQALVTDNELRRMQQHSALTKTHTFFHEQHNQLGSGDETKRQLRILQQAFEDASVRKKGTELVADEGIYEPLVAFKEYYESLSAHEIKRIPPIVKHEITQIFAIASDKKQFLRVSTCSAIRYSGLKRALGAWDNGQQTVDYSRDYYQRQQELYSYGERKNTVNHQRRTVDIFANAKDHLPITSGLINLADCEKIICSTVRDRRNLKMQDIHGFLRGLDQAEISLFLEKIKHLIRPLVKTVEDFSFVAQNVFTSSEEQQNLFDITIAANIIELVKTAEHYRLVRAYIPDLDRFHLQLQQRYPNHFELIVYRDFIEDQITVVLNEIKQNAKPGWLQGKSHLLRSEIEEESKGFFNRWFNASRYSEQAKAQMLDERLGYARQQYDGLMAPILELFRSDLIEKLIPARIIQVLFHYHPWLKANPTSFVVQQFIKTNLMSYCQQGIPVFSGPEDAYAQSSQQLINASAMSARLRRLAEFTIDPLHALHFPHRYRRVYHESMFNDQAIELNYPRFNAQSTIAQFYLTRMDLCSVLLNYCENEDCSETSIVPMSKEVFLSLPIDIFMQADYRKVFINMATEEQPLWILLSLDIYLRNWELSYPKELINEDELNLFKAHSINMKFNPVDLNFPLNNLYALRAEVSLIQQWHAVMLGLAHIIPQKVYTSLQLLKMIYNSLSGEVRQSEKEQLSIRLFRAVYPSINLPLDIKKYYESSAFVDNIISKFSDNTIEQSENGNELRVQIYSHSSHSEQNEKHVLNALGLIFFGTVKLLKISADLSSNTYQLSAIKTLFSLNYSLTNLEVIASDDYQDDAGDPNYRDVIKHALNCVARNRFLQQEFPEELPHLPREFLWDNAGAKIINYFQKNKTSNPDITQMGVLGLEHFFKIISSNFIPAWNNKYQEPGLNLNFIIDLNAVSFHVGVESAQNAAVDYLNKIIESLCWHSLQQHKCGPFFSCFEIYLPIGEPGSIDLGLKDCLINLFTAYSEFVLNNPTSTDVIVLHNASILSEGFFCSMDAVTRGGLYAMIDLPEFDLQEFDQSSGEYRVYQAYKDIQDEINSSQRKLRSSNLSKQTEDLYRDKLVPSVQVLDQNQQHSTGWGVKDEVYFLSAEVNGFEQQQQQQQAVQHKNQSHKVQPIEEAKESLEVAVVNAYEGDNSILLGRDSVIDAINNFSECFSCWVGSTHKAIHIIEKIHPECLGKLLAHKSELNFGLQKDNLPAGFYLEKIKYSESLVLRYNAHREIDDLEVIHSNKNKSKPFKQILKPLMPARKVYARRQQYDDACGQLYNYYGYLGEVEYKKICQEIQDGFGKLAAETWKNYVLQPLLNGAEVLSKQEVSAVPYSIVTLKNAGDEKSVWWELLKAHSQAIGFVRYSDIWRAYEKLLKYTQARKLVFNINSIENLIINTSNEFNAQLFLDRLYCVLRCSERQVNSRAVAQALLNQVDQIDWHQDGFYYAARYAGYQYWDPALKLSGFYSTIRNQTDYAVPWEHDADIVDPVTHALRFACQRIKLPIHQFEQFKAIIFSQQNLSPIMLRTYCACLAIGSDEVAVLSEKNNKATKPILLDVASFSKGELEILDWLNQCFDLSGDRELAKSEFKLLFSDIPAWLTVLQKAPELKSALLALSSSQDLRKLFINACGFVLQSSLLSFEHWLEKLNQLCLEGKVNFDQDPNFFRNIFQYPFLLVDPEFDDLCVDNTFFEFKPELAQQLCSIDYQSSTWFPSAAELKHVNSADDRDGHKAVFQWIDNGCLIVDQAANFRPLTKSEVEQAIIKLESHLTLTYQQQNIILCFELLTHHMAVENNHLGQKQLDNFIDLIISLDNKAHYNELGQILGVLKTCIAQHGAKAYCSVPKLTQWLNILCHKEQFQTQHFPTAVLSVVLSPEFSNNLINANLHALSDALGQKLKHSLLEIMQSNLPVEAKQLLTDLILKNQLAFAALLRPLLHTLHVRITDIPDFIPSFYKLVIKIVSERYMAGSVVPADVCKLDSDFIEYLITARQLKYVKLALAHDSLCQYMKMLGLDYLFLLHTLDSSNTALGYVAPILRKLKLLLQQWSPVERSKLVEYLQTPPFISAQQLLDLLENQTNNAPNPAEKFSLTEANITAHNNNFLFGEPRKDQAEPQADANSAYFYERKNADALIDFYEREILSKDAEGNSKRSYSMSKSEEEDFFRALNSIRQKGQKTLPKKTKQYLVDLFYSANIFAEAKKLDQVSFNLLKEYLEQAMYQVRHAAVEIVRQQAMVNMLACLREILLRKTGIWTNHTQMLSLIYSAVFEDKNIIHQFPTGDGKSVITRMRIAFMALLGLHVDVFSTKESLSYRDYIDSKPFLDAVGLHNIYLTKDSELSLHQGSFYSNGMGDICFCTPGNFSLFYSKHSFEGQDLITIDPKLRAVYLDEVDELLLDDDVQFNYSHIRGTSGSYNFDAWVYQAVYEFYQDHQESFIRNPNTNTVSISRQRHLKVLCDYIQKHAINAPENSTFVRDYILPAANNDPVAVMARDEQLRYLLNACHKAHGLENLKNYCVQPEVRTITQGNATTQLETRVAKVVVNSEIKEGATYSELVHQFLHTILNNQAAAVGEPPNFFIDPVSDIALILNTAYIVNNFYSKKEGCTATLGSEAEQALLKSEFGFDQLIKFPHHKPSQKEILPTVFCDSDDEYVEAIVALILSAHDQSPILIDCENDAEVKIIAEKLKQKLPPHISLYADTNDKGKLESEVIPLVQKASHVVVSARMGRGTNILPETIAGLFLICAYAASPRHKKQSFGRPARYGHQGEAVQVINYASILAGREWLVSQLNYSARYNALYQEQLIRFKSKLVKAVIDKAFAIPEDERNTYCEKQATTESVVLLTLAIEQEKKYFTKQKNNLMASLSGQVAKLQLSERHQNIWIDCIKQIELAWASVQPVLSQEEFEEKFISKAALQWGQFCQDTRLRMPSFSAHYQQKEHVVFLEKKNKIIAEIEVFLNPYLYSPDYLINKRYALKQDWNGFKEDIESIWHQVQPIHSEKQFYQFFISNLWHAAQELFSRHSLTWPDATSDDSDGLSDDSEINYLLSLNNNLKPDQLESKEFDSNQLQPNTQHEFHSTIMQEALLRKVSGETADIEALNKLLLRMNRSENQEAIAAVYKSLTYIFETDYFDKVYLSGIRAIVEKLLLNFENPSFYSYLVCFSYFFHHPQLALVLSDAVPSPPVFLNKSLLKLYMDIVFSLPLSDQVQDIQDGLVLSQEQHYVLTQEEKLTSFLEKLMLMLRELYQENNSVYGDDMFPQIMRLLTRSEQVTWLMAELALDETQPDAFKNCIRLFVKNIASKPRIEFMQEWLRKNAEDLFVLLPVIPRAFSLVLPFNGANMTMHTNGIENLPAANLVAGVDAKINIALWDFLLQRLPFANHTIQKQFLERFKQIDTSEIKANELVVHYQSLLEAIPPYLPLDFIVKNFSDNNREIVSKEVCKASELFNEFLFKKAIIQQASHYSGPINLSEFRSYFELFSRVSPENNIEFLKLFADANYVSLSDDIIQKIYDWYRMACSSDNKVTLKSWFNLAVKIQSLPHAYRDYFNENFACKSLLEKNRFCDTVIHYAAHLDIDARYVAHLWKFFLKSFDEKQLVLLIRAYFIADRYVLLSGQTASTFINGERYDPKYRQLLLFYAGRHQLLSLEGGNQLSVNFCVAYNEFLGRSIISTDDSLIAAIHEIKLLPVLQQYQDLHVHLTREDFAVLTKPLAKFAVTKFVGGLTKPHWAMRQRQICTLLEEINNPVGRDRGYNVWTILGAIDQLMFTVLSEDENASNEAVRGLEDPRLLVLNKPSKLYAILHKLYFEVVALALKSTRIELLKKAHFIPRLESLLTNYKAYIAERAEFYSNTVRVQQAKEAVAFLNKALSCKEPVDYLLTFDIDRSLMANKTSAVEMGSSLPAPYSLEQDRRYSEQAVAHLDEQQKWVILQLAEKIHCLGSCGQDYFMGLFLSASFDQLANPYLPLNRLVTALIKRQALVSLPIETLDALYVYYVDNSHTIQLEALLNTLEIATQLSRVPVEHPLWRSYFSDFEHASIHRKSMIKAINAGWLKLGDDMKHRLYVQKIYGQYSQMLEQVLALDETENKAHAFVELMREIEELGPKILDCLQQDLMQSNTDCFSRQIRLETDEQINKPGVKQPIKIWFDRVQAGASGARDAVSIAKHILEHAKGFLLNSRHRVSEKQMVIGIVQRLFEALLHQQLYSPSDNVVITIQQLRVIQLHRYLDILGQAFPEGSSLKQDIALLSTRYYHEDGISRGAGAMNYFRVLKEIKRQIHPYREHCEKQLGSLLDEVDHLLEVRINELEFVDTNELLGAPLDNDAGLCEVSNEEKAGLEGSSMLSNFPLGLHGATNAVVDRHSHAASELPGLKWEG